jgi:hypothetical protein
LTTVTVVVAVLEPALFVAVSVYVVVAVGETGTEPWPAVVEYEPGVIVICEAPVTFQLNVLLPPGEIELGFAVKETIVGAGVELTVTMTVAFVEPALLVAVSV